MGTLIETHRTPSCYCIIGSILALQRALTPNPLCQFWERGPIQILNLPLPPELGEIRGGIANLDCTAGATFFRGGIADLDCTKCNLFWVGGMRASRLLF